MGNGLVEVSAVGAVALPMCQGEFSNPLSHGIVGVGIHQQSPDGLQAFHNAERRAPRVLEDIQTNGTICVHIAVIDRSVEVDLRRIERIVVRQDHVQGEDAAHKGAPRRTFQQHAPVAEVFRGEDVDALEHHIADLLQLGQHSLHGTGAQGSRLVAGRLHGAQRYHFGTGVASLGGIRRPWHVGALDDFALHNGAEVHLSRREGRLFSSSTASLQRHHSLRFQELKAFPQV
eukprot:Skav220686  [mRNA]  locus=scaffold472:22197:26754:- [translate_table: standard]